MGDGSGENFIAPEILAIACAISVVLHLLGGVRIVKEDVVLVVPETPSAVSGKMCNAWATWPCFVAFRLDRPPKLMA
jgi:hypothetical protein